jgi:hypothetical protein
MGKKSEDSSIVMVNVTIPPALDIADLRTKIEQALWQSFRGQMMTPSLQATMEAIAQAEVDAYVIQQQAYRYILSIPGVFSQPSIAQPENAPYDGVRVGEVEAWRAWRVDKRCLLRSMWAGKRWLPGVPMEGDVDATVENYYGITPIKGGVYALRDVTSVIQEFGWPDNNDELLAVGSVLLSGEVIEGTKGYRASVAQVGTVVSCRDITGKEDHEALAAINALYAPPHAVPGWMTEVYYHGKRVGMARVAAGADRPDEILRSWDVRVQTEWDMLESHYTFTALPLRS